MSAAPLIASIVLGGPVCRRDRRPRLVRRTSANSAARSRGTEPCSTSRRWSRRWSSAGDPSTRPFGIARPLCRWRRSLHSCGLIGSGAYYVLKERLRSSRVGHGRDSPAHRVGAGHRGNRRPTWWVWFRSPGSWPRSSHSQRCWVVGNALFRRSALHYPPGLPPLRRDARAFEQTIGALANAVDARDRYTRGHPTG